MSARASLIVLVALALSPCPAWAGADDYPAGLFERSPLNGAPAAASRRSPSAPGQAKNLPGERANGACHHYRVWTYPWPQPC